MGKLKVKNYKYPGKKVNDTPRITRKGKAILFSVIGAVVALVIALVWIESGLENKIVIKNKSSHDIASLRFWYEDENGAVTEIMSFDGVAAKEKITKSTESLELSKLQGEAWLTVQIVFKDGGKAILQTGQFLYGFNGRIMFEVSGTGSDELMLHLKAGEGLFNSTAMTGCDDIYYINPQNGYIE